MREPQHPPREDWTKRRRAQAEWNARRSLGTWLHRYSEQLGTERAAQILAQVGFQTADDVKTAAQNAKRGTIRHPPRI